MEVIILPLNYLSYYSISDEYILSLKWSYSLLKKKKNMGYYLKISTERRMSQELREKNMVYFVIAPPSLLDEMKGWFFCGEWEEWELRADSKKIVKLRVVSEWNEKKAEELCAVGQVGVSLQFMGWNSITGCHFPWLLSLENPSPFNLPL